MAASSLGLVLVGSVDPARLRAWYAAAFGVCPDDEGVLDFGAIRVLIDKRDIAARATEPGRMILTFGVEDMAATEARLIDREVTWLREVQDTPIGKIGTLVDPDGNYVQVMEAASKPTEVDA